MSWLSQGLQQLGNNISDFFGAGPAKYANPTAPAAPNYDYNPADFASADNSALTRALREGWEGTSANSMNSNLNYLNGSGVFGSGDTGRAITQGQSNLANGISNINANAETNAMNLSNEALSNNFNDAMAQYGIDENNYQNEQNQRANAPGRKLLSDLTFGLL